MGGYDAKWLYKATYQHWPQWLAHIDKPPQFPSNRWWHCPKYGFYINQWFFIPDMALGFYSLDPANGRFIHMNQAQLYLTQMEIDHNGYFIDIDLCATIVWSFIDQTKNWLVHDSYFLIIGILRGQVFDLQMFTEVLNCQSFLLLASWTSPCCIDGLQL